MASLQKQFGDRVRELRKARGWSQEHTLPQEVIDQIHRSDRLIAIIGPGALKSLACQAEREYAFSSGKVVTAILRKGDYSTYRPSFPGFSFPIFASRDLMNL